MWKLLWSLAQMETVLSLSPRVRENKAGKELGNTRGSSYRLVRMGPSLHSLTKAWKANPSRQDLHETLRQNRPTDVREGNQVMRG